MRVYSAEETRDLLPFGALIEALREMFRAGAVAPLRHHHTIALEGQPDATLLLMPAWNPAGLGGVKIVHVNPGNAAAGTREDQGDGSGIVRSRTYCVARGLEEAAA